MVGCGFFARNHLNAWKEIEDVQIAAVCDSNLERSREAAEAFSVPRVYQDAGAMLAEERLDFVDIITQPASHRHLVELAASSRTPVICQKPLAQSCEEARTMVAVCQSAGVPFMVHENFRWQKPMRVVKELLGEIGDPFFARVMFRSGYDPSIDQPYLAQTDRFILLDVGVHILDIVRFLCGEVTSLSCVTRRVNQRIQGEDVASILLQMTNGATCVAELSYASRITADPFPQTLLHLEGSKGTLALRQDFRIVLDRGKGVREFEVDIARYAWSSSPFEVIQESVVAIQRHWVECLLEGRAPETSGADNLKTLDLVFAAYTSADTNQTVRIGKEA